MYFGKLLYSNGNQVVIETQSLKKDNWYHVYMASEAINQQNLNDYSKVQRIGSFYSNDKANVQGFTKYNDIFLWDSKAQKTTNQIIQNNPSLKNALEKVKQTKEYQLFNQLLKITQPTNEVYNELFDKSCSK